MSTDDVGAPDPRPRAEAGAPAVTPTPVRWAIGILAFLATASGVMALMLAFIGAGSPADQAASSIAGGLFAVLGLLYAAAAVGVRRGRRFGRTMSRALAVLTTVGAVVSLLQWHAIGGVFVVVLGWATLWMLGKPPAVAFLGKP